MALYFLRYRMFLVSPTAKYEESSIRLDWFVGLVCKVLQRAMHVVFYVENRV